MLITHRLLIHEICKLMEAVYVDSFVDEYLIHANNNIVDIYLLYPSNNIFGGYLLHLSQHVYRWIFFYDIATI